MVTRGLEQRTRETLGLFTIPRLEGAQQATPEAGRLPPAAATVGNALFVRTTSSKLIQEPFVIVHRRVTLLPGSRFVTVVVGDVVLVIIALLAAPCIVQVPVPVTGVLAAMVNVPLLHCSWSGPANAVVGVALFVNTSSSELIHEPLVMVQRSVTLLPVVKPVTVVFGAVGAVIVAPFAEPTTLHAPVPVTGVLALSVKFPELQSS